jgi:putative nucleotidyltransferase-like protein
MAEALFAPELLQLTALLGEGLGGPAAPQVPITRRLCALASRHQVAPLLYAVAAGGRRQVAGGDLEVLHQRYRASAARRLAALAVLERVADQFSAWRITWMVVKGATQAELLYPDPVWRDSADIDLLVPQAQFSRALDALVAVDFTASYPPVPSHGLFRKMILAAVRDVMLVARADVRDSIELHRRLFFAGGRHVDFHALPVMPGRIPSPVPGPELAFYLIAHGALSYWVRLKWLMDLVPLLAKLSRDQVLAVREQARRADAENSMAASLLLLRALFPHAALDPLQDWLNQKMRQGPVLRRLRRYAELLGREDDQKHSPLNDAMVMLEATMLLFEAPSTRLRLLASAPFSSIMRRMACRIYRAERALTLP